MRSPEGATFLFTSADRYLCYTWQEQRIQAANACPSNALIQPSSDAIRLHTIQQLQDATLSPTEAIQVALAKHQRMTEERSLGRVIVFMIPNQIDLIAHERVWWVVFQGAAGRLQVEVDTQIGAILSTEDYQ